MKRLVCCLGLMLIAASSSGCALGQAEWYEAYSGYGGRWERTDRFNGRVGSAFTDVGQRLDENLEEAPAPTIQEEIPPPQ